MNNRSGRRPHWPRGARVAAIITVMAVALVTAACGSTSSSPPSTGSGAPNPGSSGGSQSALAFASCVRAHGVPNFPDPDSTGQFSKTALAQLGVSATRLRAAEAPCLHQAPSGPAPLTAAQQQDYLRAAACMRSHGFTSFPDPVFSGGGVSFPAPASNVNTSSPQFVQAQQVCKRLIPAGLPYSGG